MVVVVRQDQVGSQFSTQRGCGRDEGQGGEYVESETYTVKSKIGNKTSKQYVHIVQYMFDICTICRAC